MVIEIAENENFFDVYSRENLPIVLYGAGNNLRNYMEKIPRFDMICDKNRVGEMIDDVEINSPQSISSLGEKVYVIVTVYETETYNQILRELNSIATTVILIHARTNTGFVYDFWSTNIGYKSNASNAPLRINLVCSEDTWIFRKFADRMAECLEKEKVNVSICKDTRRDVDINHHIPYVAYHPFPNDTLMITHVDNMAKVKLLKKQLNIARVGICMSKQTMNDLTSYGIEKSKLCYINPAHDGLIEPHKYLIGITHKCHDSEDLRKRATALLDVIEGVDCHYFKFFIMGGGWTEIVNALRNKGFEVEYYEEFDSRVYINQMQKIDYFLYMGFDEGTMGYLDAMMAGAGTIVTPQGYHLDTRFPIDYPCCTIHDFRNALLDLQTRRKRRIDAVRDWTWDNYTHKHMAIWNYLLKRETLNDLYKDQHFYNDGIYSLLIEDNRI